MLLLRAKSHYHEHFRQILDLKLINGLILHYQNSGGIKFVNLRRYRSIFLVKHLKKYLSLENTFPDFTTMGWNYI